VAQSTSRRRILSTRRILLLAVVLLVLIGGTAGFNYERRRYAALAYASQADGGIQSVRTTWALGKLSPPWLAEVDLVLMRDAPCDLRRIAAFGEARNLLFTGCTLDREGLVHLREFSQLEELWLERTNITDDDLAVIARECPRLQRLSVKSTAVTDTGLASLAKLPLTHLSLAGTQITDDGLRHLNSDWLSALNLDDTAITDAGLRHLARLRYAASLSLNRTGVTDAGLSTLASLPVRGLFLTESKITLEVVPILERMPSLEHVELSSPPFTPANTATLRARRITVELRPRSEP
jgi:hypothetical protein